jgi:hypothetical protein
MSTIERLAENAKAYADESGDDEFTVFIKLLLDAAAEHAVLREALAGMVAQHGCDCGHPHCNRCAETRECKAALAQGEVGNDN